VNEQNESVSLDEYVLRRIHKSHCNFALDTPITRAAFQPNRHDTQGISVYRERFVTPEALANSGRKAGEYYVARLSVATLVSTVGVSVKQDPQDDELPGHCLIPELRLEMPKEGSKELQRHLAVLASASIVYTPEST
jgi:hypothetical protein